MKRGDFIWVAALALVVFFMLSPFTNSTFEQLTATLPYLMGFVKFAILATMGELLAIRIGCGAYRAPVGLVWRIVIWGLIGVLITLMFNVFAGGVKFAMDKGLLPFAGNAFAFAFFTSAIMNCFFAPTFMALHKFSDTYLDLSAGGHKVTLDDVVTAVDWHNYIGFVLLKTIPLFWIPAHTVTFILPPQYRVVAAAFLSIALGLILSLAKRKNVKS